MQTRRPGYYSRERRSDLTPSGFSPLSLPSLQRWIDAGDVATRYQDAAGTIPALANNDPLGLILDKSGNSRHYTQSVISRRSRVRVLDPDFANRDVALFDGTDDCLTSTFHSTGAKTVALVFRRTALAFRTALTWSATDGASQSALFLPTNGSFLPYAWCFNYTGSSGAVGINLAADVARHTLVVTYTGGASNALVSYSAYLDNVLRTLAAAGTFGSGVATYGAVGADKNGATPGNTRLAEVLEFGADLTGPQLDALRAWLAARYP